MSIMVIAKPPLTVMPSHPDTERRDPDDREAQEEPANAEDLGGDGRTARPHELRRGECDDGDAAGEHGAVDHRSRDRNCDADSLRDVARDRRRGWMAESTDLDANERNGS